MLSEFLAIARNLRLMCPQSHLTHSMHRVPRIGSRDIQPVPWVFRVVIWHRQNQEVDFYIASYFFSFLTDILVHLGCTSLVLEWHFNYT